MAHCNLTPNLTGENSDNSLAPIHGLSEPSRHADEYLVQMAPGCESKLRDVFNGDNDGDVVKVGLNMVYCYISY